MNRALGTERTWAGVLALPVVAVWPWKCLSFSELWPLFCKMRAQISMARVIVRNKGD